MGGWEGWGGLWSQGESKDEKVVHHPGVFFKVSGISLVSQVFVVLLPYVLHHSWDDDSS